MSFVRQIFRRTPRILALGVATVTVLGVTGPVAAAAPFQTQFAYTDSFVDPDVCAADALVLNVVERVRGVYLEWDGPDGTFERATVSVDTEFDIAASNGVT